MQPSGHLEHRRESGVALQTDDVGLVGSSHPAAHQALQGGLARRRLAQRWEHLRDVAKKQRIWTNDEHAGTVEHSTMLEQEEGCTMQAHGRLPGARPALHDEAGVER